VCFTFVLKFPLGRLIAPNFSLVAPVIIVRRVLHLLYLCSQQMMMMIKVIGSCQGHTSKNSASLRAVRVINLERLDDYKLGPNHV